MIRVLHLGTEKGWRGGENQVRLLIDGLHGKVAFQAAASPKGSIAFKETRWNCPMVGLASGNPWSLWNIFALVKFIKKHQINIIDAHTAKAHSMALNVAAFVPDLKVVVHRRVDNVPKSSYLTRKKYFHPRISYFTAISNFIAQVLKTYGVPAEKVRVARSAVSGEIYKKIDRQEAQKEWKSRYGIPNDHILIGNASALSPQKGYETLLKAARLLKEKKQNFKVLIAGDGELKNSLLQMNQNLGLEGDVHFVGFLKEVPRFLSALDILAVPSNNEGLGTVILDGFLAGCCVVGSSVGGIPEIVQHNKTGLVQPPGDYMSLAKNLEYLIDHPDQRQLFANQGRDFVESEFSLQSMIEGNLKIYEDLVKDVK